MSEVVLSLFNEAWYLARYPDVAAAVERGETTAYAHFESYGKTEGRSPGPLFDADFYLSSNPDVGTAALAGDTTAYDHFLQFGMAEGRDPLAILDLAFYLAQNPDVDAAVKAGQVSAVEHLIMHGVHEGRPILPFFDVQSYLNANGDVAAAVSAGATDALTHLLAYGIAEGRLLGQGIDLQYFSHDPVFNTLLSQERYEDALGRVGEVAPFMSTFVPPAGWTPAPDTPIPLGFVVPPGGAYLVVPDGVIVPPDTHLPDAFGPQPDPDDGGHHPGKYYELTTAVETLRGTDGNDEFHAPGDAGETLNTGDFLDGRGGQDILNIDAGGYGATVMPTLRHIEVINNANLGRSYVGTDDGPSHLEWEYEDKALDLGDATGVREVWSVFPSGESDISEVLSLPTATYVNATSSMVFGVKASDEEDSDTDGLDMFGLAALDVGFRGDPAANHETLKLKLSGTDGVNFLALSWNDRLNTGVDRVEIDTAAGDGLNAVHFAEHATVQNISVKGAGNLAILADVLGDASQPALSQLTHVDAHTATGSILAILARITSLQSVALGSSDDLLVLSFEQLSGEGKVFDGGAGDDSILVGMMSDSENDGTGTIDLSGVINFETVVVEFSNDFSGTLKATGGAEDVILNIEWDVDVNLDAGSASNYKALTINLAECSSFSNACGHAGVALEALTINGLEDSEAHYVIAATETGLTSIDLSEMSGFTIIEYECGAEPASTATTVRIGEGDVYHEARADRGAVEGWDTFVFTGTDIGTVTFENFTSVAAGQTDTLDFSQFNFGSLHRIDEISDLCIEYDTDGDTTYITAAADQFNGTIALVGGDFTASTAYITFSPAPL